MDTAVEDDYLLTRAQEGYLPAFEELVRRHQARAYTVAVRMLGDVHEAEDVTQEAMVKAWTGLASFHRDASFGTWLHRIVINACLSHQRRRRPLPVQPDEQRPGTARTEEAVEARARDAELYASIRALPEDQRAPLVLTTFLDLSYDEAAEVLQVSSATVRGRVARARRALLARMEGWA